MSEPRKVFVADRTSQVAMNFQVDTSLIRQWVPRDFQPDTYNGECYVSLVAVSLRNVHGRGIPFPVCLGLGSIYLRVYITRETSKGLLRGFRQVRSIVTSSRGRWLLQPIFGSDLKVGKIRQLVSRFDGSGTEADPPSAEISWTSGKDKVLSRIKVTGRHRMNPGQRDSKVAYILNHHWLFTEKEGKTVAYQYRGAPASIWTAGHVTLQGETSELIGEKLSKVMKRKPASVFLVEKSPVTVSGPFPVEAALDIAARSPAPAT